MTQKTDKPRFRIYEPHNSILYDVTHVIAPINKDRTLNLSNWYYCRGNQIVKIQ